MELDPFHSEFTMAHSHDDSVLGPGTHLETGRHVLGIDHQGVVAGGGKGVGEVAKQASAIVVNFRGLPMENGARAHDATSERFTDGLVTKADAKNGNSSRQGLDQGHGNSRAGRNPWSG